MKDLTWEEINLSREFLALMSKLCYQWLLASHIVQQISALFIFVLWLYVSVQAHELLRRYPHSQQWSTHKFQTSEIQKCSVRKAERKKVQTLGLCFWSTMEHTNWAQELKILLNEFSFAYWIVHFIKTVPSSKKISVIPVTF